MATAAPETEHRRLSLGALVRGSGGHIAGWRHPLARPDGQLDFAFHTELARTLERGRFDAVFIADVVAIRGRQLDSLSRTGRAEHFEPLTLLAGLSLVTEHIGLVATATTTYHHPFHIARKFASLDHLSHGRAGWNIGHPERDYRSRRAAEFVDVVRELWDSFDDGANVRDKALGRYYDPAGLRTPHHRGEHFTVRGPLNISRPPQGHPVLFQTSTSPADQDFAARYAEVVLTTAHTLDSARAKYADVKTAVARYGRDPRQVLVWPGLSPLVASTEAEALARVAELDALVHDDVARRLAQDELGDSSESLDGAIVAGTPEQVADHIEAWFRAEAADGFNISFPYLPGPAEDFVDQVVPILQRRGLLPREYEGTTLRENLGLPRPAALPRRPDTDVTDPITPRPKEMA